MNVHLQQRHKSCYAFLAGTESVPVEEQKVLRIARNSVDGRLNQNTFCSGTEVALVQCVRGHRSHCLETRGLLHMRIAYNFFPVVWASSPAEFHMGHLRLG